MYIYRYNDDSVDAINALAKMTGVVKEWKTH